MTQKYKIIIEKCESSPVGTGMTGYFLFGMKFQIQFKVRLTANMLTL